MKKSIFKRWWFWVIVVIIVGGIGSSLNKQPKKVGEKTTTDKKAQDISKTEDKKADIKTEKNKTNDTKKEEQKVFKVGDIVELKNFKVVVNKVYTVEGDQFSKPKEGNEFLAVDCTLENISNEDQAVSSVMMFKVVDKDGRACEYSFLGQSAAKAGQLDGTVGAGRKMSGVYVVEVPKGKKGLELVFDSTFFTGGQVVIELR